MLPNILAAAADFVRREDGRTAVEYAIALNVIVMIGISVITASGYSGRRVATKICDGAVAAYESSQHTVDSLLRRTRSTAGPH